MMKSLRFLDLPVADWCNPENKKIAKEIVSLIYDNFKGDLSLEIWDSRTYSTNRYTCLWIGFKDANTYKTRDGKSKLCMLFAINLVNNSAREDADVCFKFMSLLDKQDLGLADWKSDNRGYWMVPYKVNKDKLPKAMLMYLKTVREHFDKGTLPKFSNFKLSNP